MNNVRSNEMSKKLAAIKSMVALASDDEILAALISGDTGGLNKYGKLDIDDMPKIEFPSGFPRGLVLAQRPT